jgi:hypothetical protein
MGVSSMETRSGFPLPAAWHGVIEFFNRMAVQDYIAAQNDVRQKFAIMVYITALQIQTLQF